MIGERIREMRQAQGRSLADIAGKAKISVATLSRIENDKQSLDLVLFLSLAEVLEVTASELLTSNGESEAEGSLDPLARRIAMLESKKRTELWREIAVARRVQRGRDGHADTAQHVDEVLAHLDFLREELETVRTRIKKR